MVLKNEFIYYSEEWRAIEVNNVGQSVRPGGLIGSFDICPSCYSSRLESCKKNINKFKAGSIKCDLCPLYISGSKFVYFRVMVDKADVSSDGHAGVERKFMDFNVCLSCKNQVFAKMEQTKSKGGDWS
jgi:hypothetical protein